MLKTVSSVANALGALNYKGTWDASTNTPTLTSGVGTQGDYYVVSVAGATDLDGITNWGVGDWATFNGSVWQRVEGGADGNFVNLTASGTATITGLSSLNSGAKVSGGALPGATTGLFTVSDLSTGKLTSGGASRASSITTYYDDTYIEIVAGVSAGYMSGISLGGRAYAGTGADAITLSPRGVPALTLAGATGAATFADNIIIGTSGKGIDFSATGQAPGMTSELLDDYEEGTWDPVYVPQIGSFATMTMDISNAKYTKIGRFVYVQASILTDSVDITGGSGGLRLSGFPFASSGFGSFVISYAQAWGGDVPLYGYIENASTYANLRYRTSVNGADSAMLVSDLTNGAVANQNYMIISGVYTA